MSVMLATQNPDAARRATPSPMPSLGDTVVYFMRPGNRRAGQTSVPGFVLGVDADNRQLKLLVIYDHQDMMTMERVPERVGSDQGWVPREGADGALIAALRKEIAEMSDGLEAFKIELAQTLFGDHDKPALSFVDRMDAFEKTLKALKAKK